MVGAPNVTGMFIFNRLCQPAMIYEGSRLMSNLTRASKVNLYTTATWCFLRASLVWRSSWRLWCMDYKCHLTVQILFPCWSHARHVYACLCCAWCVVSHVVCIVPTENVCGRCFDRLHRVPCNYNEKASMEEYEFERLKLGHRGAERQAPNCTKKGMMFFF